MRNRSGSNHASPSDLVHDDEVLDGVLGGPDPAGHLDADAAAGRLGEVPDRLEHHKSDRQRGRGADFAGRSLYEVGPADHRRPACTPDVVVSDELTRLEDHLEVRPPAGGLYRPHFVEHQPVMAGQKRAPVDDHVDLVGPGGDRVGDVCELDRQRGTP